MTPRRSAKWKRGQPVPAVVAVVSLAVEGDGVSEGREGLRIRAAAANLFQVRDALLRHRIPKKRKADVQSLNAHRITLLVQRRLD